MKKIKYLYFKTSEHRQEYKGIRFFRMDGLGETVIQVVLYPGEEKRGRGHVIGISTMGRITFFSNYLALGYAIPCSEKEYKSSFEKAITLLS